jgi:hypothetical protein
MRHNGKLIFALCRTCAESYQSTACNHTPQQRALRGTWATPELHKSLELGYQVLEIYEVWHYEEVSTKDRNPLFRDYIKMFLKVKVQASGWPSWVKNDLDKIQFIIQFEEKEGIQLDPDDMEFNSSLRIVAKLCLNR